jgi:predicted kinase
MNWNVRYANEQPNYYCLVGMPGTGKSTYSQKLQGTRVSSDDFIDKKAADLGITYSQAFDKFSKDAMSYHDQLLRDAIQNKQSIIHDRTNLSRGGRAKYLKQIPNNYRKIAIVFTADKNKPEEWRKQLTLRSGKTIPNNIMQSMAQSFQYPNKSEGFDVIKEVNW